MEWMSHHSACWPAAVGEFEVVWSLGQCPDVVPGQSSLSFFKKATYILLLKLFSKCFQHCHN